MNGNTSTDLRIYNASDFDNGGPFASDISQAPCSGRKANAKRKRHPEKKKEKPAPSSTPTTSKQCLRKKKKKSDDESPSPSVSTGNVQETLRQRLNLTDECVKYEALREQFRALYHDFAHLRYRYYTQLERNEQKNGPPSLLPSRTRGKEEEEEKTDESVCTEIRSEEEEDEEEILVCSYS